MNSSDKYCTLHVSFCKLIAFSSNILCVYAAPSDFLNKTGVVTFSSGMELSSDFTVNITDNEESECLESFKVEFMIPEIMAKVKVLNSNTATVNIGNDDC